MDSSEDEEVETVNIILKHKRENFNPVSDVSDESTSEVPSAITIPHQLISEQATIRRKIILANLSSQQLDRYEQFRQTSLSKRTMKRIVQKTLNVVPRNDTIIVLSGVAKILVAELIEAALDLRGRGENMRNVPLQAEDIRKAYEKIKPKSKICFPGFGNG